MKTSVWAGRQQLRNPEKWVDLILSSGCKRVDLVVNDLSAYRVRKSGLVTRRGVPTRKHFDTYDTAKLEKFSRVAVDAGLEVHTLFWAVPTMRGITQAACWLNTFASVGGVAGHVLDAEEPITKSSYVDYNHDVELAARHLDQVLHRPWGVTHIGYAPIKYVSPFVKRASYALPQTYLTTTSGLTASSIPRLVERTRVKLGAKQVVGGFALYRQPKRDNIAKTLEALKNLDINLAVGWHAAGLRKYSAILEQATNEYNA